MGEPQRAFSAFIPVIIITTPVIFICHRLAKEKGKNVSLWTVLGCIPIVNYFALIYAVGAANTILEQKLELVLSQMVKEKF